MITYWLNNRKTSPFGLNREKPTINRLYQVYRITFIASDVFDDPDSTAKHVCSSRVLLPVWSWGGSLTT
jgi:hypothetical protein